jgi:hypothetical protein
VNTNVPVARKYATQPSAYRSARASIVGLARAISGAMYSGVPSVAPSMVRCKASAPPNGFASPKSSTFTKSQVCATWQIITFDGFRSRWTMF